MDDSGYNYTPMSGQIPSGWRDQSNAFNRQNATDYSADLNKGVAEQSNLMGPSNPSDPEADALAQKSRQMYQAGVNQVQRQAMPRAVEATTALQKTDLANQAAIYSNQQSQAQINYQQAAFKREVAIKMAEMKRGLYKDLFGGFAKVGGFAAAQLFKSSTSDSGGPVAPGTMQSAPFGVAQIPTAGE